MKSSWVAIAVAFVFASGCVKQQDWIDRTLVTVDVTGVWEGTFTGTGGSGDVRFVLQQQGPKVKGEMKIPPVVSTVPTAPPGVRPTPGASTARIEAEAGLRIEGTVSGDTFTFQFLTGPQGHGEFQVNGDEMSGSWSRLYNQAATLRRQQ
jgi:hypothetical protein